MRFENRDGALVCKTGGETLRIEPWGKDSLRVRALPTEGVCRRNFD